MSEKKVQVISFFVMHKYEDHEMTTVKNALGLILLEPYRTKSKTAHISLPMMNGSISKFKCKDILKLEFTGRCLIVSVYNADGPRKKSIMFFILDQELNLDLWQTNFKPRQINIPEFCDREFRHSKCRISDTQLGMYFMVLLQKTEEGCRRFHQAMKDSQTPQVLWILGLYKIYILYMQEKENMKLNPKQFKKKLIYSEDGLTDGKIFRLSGGLVIEDDLIKLCGETHRCNGTFGNLKCARVSFHKCSNCNMARYCDTKCQASNFQKHKLECQSLAKDQESLRKVHKEIEQFLGNRLDCKLNLDIETFISVLSRKLYEDFWCESLGDRFNQLLVNFPDEIHSRHMFNQLLKLRLSFVKLPCNNHVIHKVLSQDNLIDLILKESFRRYKKMQKSKTQKSKRQRGG